MKTLFVNVLTGAALFFAHAASAQTGGTAANASQPASNTRNMGSGCAACTQKPPAEAASAQPIPGTSETMLVGRIENLIPIGVVAVLGCETCAGKAVAWALQQGSPKEDVERALRTVEAMQKLDCFKQQFGPEAATRLEKPLAAGREVLRQAGNGAGK